MWLDDLIRETHKTALWQQKESGAALLLLQASIRKRNPDTSASASAAIVPGLLLALLVLASSKVGKSHDVGIPYTACGSCCSLRLKGLCENRYAKEPAQGFSREQIARLQRVKALFQRETTQEIEASDKRQAFVRWLYLQGRLQS